MPAGGADGDRGERDLDERLVEELAGNAHDHQGDRGERDLDVAPLGAVPTSSRPTRTTSRAMREASTPRWSSAPRPSSSTRPTAIAASEASTPRCSRAARSAARLEDGGCVDVEPVGELAGHDSPRKHTTVERVRKGIRRTLGTAQKGRAPLLLEQLRRVCTLLPADAAGDRDRALLLLGWAAM